MTATGDYTKQVQINAAPEKVFATLTAAAEFGAQRAPAIGSVAEGANCVSPLTASMARWYRGSGKPDPRTTVIWDARRAPSCPSGQVSHLASPSAVPGPEDATWSSGAKA
jgi:hypothetical protein